MNGWLGLTERIGFPRLTPSFARSILYQVSIFNYKSVMKLKNQGNHLLCMMTLIPTGHHHCILAMMLQCRMKQDIIGCSKGILGE